MITIIKKIITMINKIENNIFNANKNQFNKIFKCDRIRKNANVKNSHK